MKTFLAVGVLSPRRSEALTTNSQPSKRLVMCGIRISTRKLGSCGSSCPYEKLHLSLVVRQNCEGHDSHLCNMFYKRECQEKKLPLRLEVAGKSFLTSSPCIDMRIRDFPDSPDSSCWRNDVHR